MGIPRNGTRFFCFQIPGMKRAVARARDQPASIGAVGQGTDAGRRANGLPRKIQRVDQLAVWNRIHLYTSRADDPTVILADCQVFPIGTASQRKCTNSLGQFRDRAQINPGYAAMNANQEMGT